MADYGAILTDQNGNLWSTPQTTPMSLVQKTSVNVNARSYGTVLPVNNNSPFMVCAHSDTFGVCFYIRFVNGSFTFVAEMAEAVQGNIGNITIYSFGYVIPQPVPAWGIAIWNEQGQCILTNETKLIPPPVGYGTVGDPNNTGLRVDVTIPGKWAVIPKLTGNIVGVINSGGVIRPFSSDYMATAQYNGSTTRIYSAANRQASGQVQNISYPNTNDPVFAMDVSRF